jgi:putative spermidine/putrescine transport system ATP-binding protein
MSAALDILHLCRQYGRVQALHDVSLHISPGEFVTLLGPSGSGKSTILKLLAGFEQPTSGDVRIDGNSVVHVPPHRRGIGMVFQNYALFPHMTVGDNIAFPLRVRNLSENEITEKVARVVDITRLRNFEQRFPRELSGGQQQRVALARAIVFDPKVLLMDEPLGALDKHLREQLKFEIKRIQQEFQMTVLYVTHDQDEALVMSDRIVVLRDGRLKQVASPQELYARPRNKFIASFIGEANVIPCAAKDGRLLLTDGSALPAIHPSNAEQEECWLMIRPELVDIEYEARPGTLRGRLRQVVFLGEVTRYVVDVGNAAVTSKKQNRDCPALIVGQDIFLGWRPQDAIILRD